MLEKFFAYLFLACCWIFHSIWKWHELRSFLYSFSSLMYLKNETSNFQNGILLWRYTVCLIIKSTKIKRKLYVSTRNLDDFILFFHRIWKWRWIITEIILISRYYSIKIVYIYIYQHGTTAMSLCKDTGKGAEAIVILKFAFRRILLIFILPLVNGKESRCHMTSHFPSPSRTFFNATMG